MPKKPQFKDTFLLNLSPKSLGTLAHSGIESGKTKIAFVSTSVDQSPLVQSLENVQTNMTKHQA